MSLLLLLRSRILRRSNHHFSSSPAPLPLPPRYFALRDKVSNRSKTKTHLEICQVSRSSTSGQYYYSSAAVESLGRFLSLSTGADGTIYFGSWYLVSTRTCSVPLSGLQYSFEQGVRLRLIILFSVFVLQAENDFKDLVVPLSSWSTPAGLMTPSWSLDQSNEYHQVYF